MGLTDLNGELDGLINLRKLNLEGNRLTYAGIKDAFRDLIKLDHYLKFDGNPIERFGDALVNIAVGHYYCRGLKLTMLDWSKWSRSPPAYINVENNLIEKVVNVQAARQNSWLVASGNKLQAINLTFSTLAISLSATVVSRASIINT